MKCDNCGSEFRSGDVYCPQCGMELFQRQYKPPTTGKKSLRDSEEYKPLQKRYMQGQYPKTEEEAWYQEEKPQNYEEGSYNYSNNLDYSDYDEYQEYEQEKRGSSWGTVGMLLLLALVVGFVIGMLIFSSNSQSIPPVRIR